VEKILNTLNTYYYGRIIFGLTLLLATVCFSEAKASAEQKKEATFDRFASSNLSLESAEINVETLEPIFFQGTICTFYVGESYEVEGFGGTEVWTDITLSCFSCSFCPGDVINIIHL